MTKKNKSGINKTAILIVVLFMTYIKSTGQSAAVDKDTCHIQLISSVRQDSIILRWAPDNAFAWKFMQQSGYIVERAEIPDTDSSKPLQFERLTPYPLKPLAKEDWERQFKKEDKYAAIAMYLMYSETNITSTDLGEAVDRTNDMTMRHSFALFSADIDAKVAQASGLRFVDKPVKKKTGYLYKVYFASSNPAFYCDTAYQFVRTDEIEKTPSTPNPQIINGDGEIKLEYKHVARLFSGYYIERADADSEAYIRLNDSPLVDIKPDSSRWKNAYFTDSIANYRKVKYRMIGITPFGETAIPSNPIEAMARDLTPPVPALITSVVDNGKRLLNVKWILPEISNDLDKILVSKSSAIDGTYNIISDALSKKDSVYTDLTTDPYNSNFYKIVTIDTAGNFSLSLPFHGFVTDSFPPAIPEGLSGYADTNAIVHLKWNLGKELDLKGYRVYFANSPYDEFTNIASYPVIDTVFKDTIELRTLTKHIYYAIAALDNNYNHSQLSPWIRIRRPDVIPPVAPLIKDILVEEDIVNISWINSTSNDVDEHILYRRTNENEEWTVVAKWKGYPDVRKFEDKDLLKRSFFEYSMTARDSSNLLSEYSPAISIRTYDTGKRDGIVNLSIANNSASKENQLTWLYDKEGDYSFQIYRAYENYGLRKYKIVNGDSHGFTDKEAKRNGEYTYAVKVIYMDGGESSLSEKVNVTVK